MLHGPLARAILLVILAGSSLSACLPGSCNCPNTGGTSVFVPAVLDVQVTASGAGCPGRALCRASEGYACTEWNIPLSHTGSCMVSAQAADGQHATISVNVRAEDLGCCGTRYTPDPPGALAAFPNFSLADAGTPDGG
jgi:hypothetical protein